jgi:hypothetical protein
MMKRVIIFFIFAALASCASARSVEPVREVYHLSLFVPDGPIEVHREGMLSPEATREWVAEETGFIMSPNDTLFALVQVKYPDGSCGIGSARGLLPEALERARKEAERNFHEALSEK